MERKSLQKERRYLYFLIIIFLVGIIGHILPEIRWLMEKLTPYTLALCGGIVLYRASINAKANFILWSAAAYIVTFAIEAAGVKTGMIFGEYTYGDVLGIKLLGVPLIIGFNWVVIILGAHLLAADYLSKKTAAALLTGTFSFIFDFLMEPTAIKLNYWRWQENSIPLQNYLAWFLIAMAASLTLSFFKIRTTSRLPVYYLAIQMVFFLTLLILL